MKTPMEKLFEKLESRKVPTNTYSIMWETMKNNFLDHEILAMTEQYWEGYREGQHSGDQTAVESFIKTYKNERTML